LSALIGYPVASYRGWLAAEMEEREQFYFPRMEELTREWSSIVEARDAEWPGFRRRARRLTTSRSRTGRKTLRASSLVEAWADRRESVASSKNKVTAWAQKKLCFRQGALASRDALQWASRRNARELGTRLLARLDCVWPARPALGDDDGAALDGSAQADADREPGFQERDLASLRERLERDQSKFDERADEELLFSWLKRALGLPREQRHWRGTGTVRSRL